MVAEALSESARSRAAVRRAPADPRAVGVATERRFADRLLASWQRSEEYGVSPDHVEPAFTGIVDEESLFVECGHAVLAELSTTLADEPISLMLTDADGLVLKRLSGDRSLLRALDVVHLAPGFTYSEQQAGTNGLGLALADRVPTVVHAEQHYAQSLATYTCAAVPVLDPVTGRLEGCVNVTTPSRASSDLLLALAQSAAGTTTALMLARSRGSRPRPTARGHVFRVTTEPGAGTARDLSPAWTEAVEAMVRALREGRIVVAVGEAGAGRATALAQAHRRLGPADRILSASPPAAADTDAWLALWSPELGKPRTAVVVRDVDSLPVGAAERLSELVTRARTAAGRDVPHGTPPPVSFTAGSFGDVPAPLARLVETVVQVPPLRERPDDVLPLARHLARRVRGREVGLSAGAERALRDHSWPGNVVELSGVVREAASRTDVIDLRHLPAEVLSRTSRRLSRIEAFERDEIVRVLTRPGIAMKDAAEELGMSRATIYRKVAQYDLRLPRQ